MPVGGLAAVFRGVRVLVLAAAIAVLVSLGSRVGAAAPLFPQADLPPYVVSTFPADGARGVAGEAATDGSLAVTFSEPVALDVGALEIICGGEDAHVLSAAGGDTSFTFTSDRPFLPGQSCVATVLSGRVSDLDGEDPPDAMPADFSWAFRTAAEAVLINELDAVTAGGRRDFIELYDGGRGRVALDGLALALIDGDTGRVYLSLGLDGFVTDEAGFFVIGTAAVVGDLLIAADALRDGPDAVAVYAGAAADYPYGAPLSTANVVDAAVYGPAHGAVLGLLLAGEGALDEGAGGAAEAHSSRRCPDGGGGARRTGAYGVGAPTPGAANDCRPPDVAPLVVSYSPIDGATGVALDAAVEVTFSEPVAIDSDAVEIHCDGSGAHKYDAVRSENTYNIQPGTPFIAGERCEVFLSGNGVHDLDEEDPPDLMISNLRWAFMTASPPPDFVVINELDADTPGVDAAEFIELYDGGRGHTALDGLAVVLFNGETDKAYLTIDLGGYETNAEGYFMLANAAVPGAGAKFPNGVLQNGPDAVALLAGSAADYPVGTAVAEVSPLDAVVYGRASSPDAGLLPLLNPGQSQVDENGRGKGGAHSLQRCPNGAGGRRNTSGYKANTPTPGASNDCVTDTPPAVVSFSPPRNANAVDIYSLIAVTFNEPVQTSGAWATVKCDKSGEHSHKTTAAGETLTLTMNTPFNYEETCQVSINPQHVTDVDEDDPPDAMDKQVNWSFTTAAAPAGFVLINEIDADTPSSDTAEFIELYDGGDGRTALDGLVVVLYNGSDKKSYRSIDLDGYETDKDGYFVIGNAAVNPDLLLANGALQNGPDAVTLFAGDATQFPTGTAVRVDGLIDAVAYGEPDDMPAELLQLLAAGEGAADESGRGAADLHSLQRCPNGAGGQRRTANFRPNQPTPGAANVCVADDAPSVSAVTPVHGASGVSVHEIASVTFSEPVTLSNGAARLACGAVDWDVSISGGPTTFVLEPEQPLPSGTLCTVQVMAALVSDIDADDPPDRPTNDYEWSFTTADAEVADFVLINEVDADTPGSDKAEFIELYDGGIGRTSLDGLVIVFWNGQNDKVYRTIDLAGQQTSADGYFVLGNKGVAGVDLVIANGAIQNGPDAVALYTGRPSSFPSGTSLILDGLVDAIVYGLQDKPDEGLLQLLLSGQQQVDESGLAAADLHSLQRCPDGEGGDRRTDAYQPAAPTPGVSNDCAADLPPTIVSVSPPDGAGDVLPDTDIGIVTSEDVTIDGEWVAINCDLSGSHSAKTSGGPREFLISPDAPLAPGESCEVTVIGVRVHDADENDPPDTMVADFTWHFTISAGEPAAVLINELDSDTPGNDTAEFIELFDGGVGEIDLSGLVLVLINGKDDKVYRAIDLDGYQTGPTGYFVIGGAAVAPDLTLGRGVIQNGPDAVAIYAGRAADFPSGAPLTTTGLIDAIVYGPGGAPDEGLLVLLEAGELQIDENVTDAELDTLQRCPNGSGAPRRTSNFIPRPPTPGEANDCPIDGAPYVSEMSPSSGATGVALTASIFITFSEAVEAAPDWFSIMCDASGGHAAVSNGGPILYTLTVDEPYIAGETCAVTVFAAAVRDTDTVDPPDQMTSDYTWQFHTAPDAPPPPPTADFTSNSPLMIGQMAEFVASVTGPGPLTLTWDFGDGSPPVTEARPTHHYAAVGTYIVTLAVSGATGTASTTGIVMVRPRLVWLPAAFSGQWPSDQ